MQGFAMTRRIVATGVLVLVAAGALTTWTSADLLRRQQFERHRASVLQASRLLDASVGPALMRKETDAVQTLLAESVERGVIAHAVVSDASGKIVAQAGRNTPRFDHSGPVHVDGVRAGSLQLALPDDPAGDALVRLALQNMAILSFAVLALGLLLAAFARPLGRQAESFMALARRLGAGEGGAVRDPAGDDPQAPGSGGDGPLVAELRGLCAGLERRMSALEEARDAADDAREAKTVLLRKMTGELRTPMQGMLGVLETLRDSSLDAHQEAQLSLAARSGETLLSVVNDILEFDMAGEALRSQELANFSPAALGNDVVSLFRPLAQVKGLSLELETDSLPLYAIGAPVRLQRVLYNLVGNAVKFTDRGGIVLRLRGFSAMRRLLVEVQDSGPGIDPDRLPRLCDASFSGADSSRRRSAGTGLGLASAAATVKALGGELAVRSAPGTGAVFYFDLPLERAAAPAADSPPGADRSEIGLPAATRKARVLVAEDAPATLYALQVSLENLGHTVVSAQDGAEAVELFRRGGIDAVVMDCQMPELDGYGATAAIRTIERERQSEPVPVIGVTAAARPTQREVCLAAGMNDYLPKPFLSRDVARMLARWLEPSGRG